MLQSDGHGVSVRIVIAAWHLKNPTVGLGRYCRELVEAIARTERGAPDATGVEFAVFCQLYLSALDLLDDVQDQDLAGKPHAEAGPAIALNSGLFLLFLGLAALERGIAATGQLEALQLPLRIAGE